MTISEVLLADFDMEAVATRRVLERIPDDRADWKPHEKSMALGSIVSHVASLPAFGNLILTTPQMNMATDAFPQYKFTTAQHAVEYAAGAGAELRTSLSKLSDEDLLTEWKFLYGDHLIAAESRLVSYRTMCFNHLIHHRGQLNVYLRLLDIKVPGLYGPSADEPFGG